MEIKLTTDTSFKRRKAASPSASASEKKEKAKSPFQSILDEVLPVGDLTNIELHELWDRLPGAERNLLDHPSERNLVEYRELVRSIANATLKKNIKVVKMDRRSRNGEKMELRVIRILDERLQQMVRMMQSSRNSAFQMMKTMGEIRGLLFDMRDSAGKTGD
jgi:uncharacterized protein YaaR (DUF327 family)